MMLYAISVVCRGPINDVERRSVSDVTCSVLCGMKSGPIGDVVRRTVGSSN
jgi:hypothetical protein